MAKGLRKQMVEFSGGRPGVFVTGASSGIGAAIAVELARTGYRVGAASRRGTAPLAPEGAGEIVPIVFDVTDGDAAPEVLRAFAESCQDFSGVVNVAGLHLNAPSADLDLVDLQRVLDVNLIASVRLAQLAFRLFEGRGGYIANIGSFYGNRGVPQNLAYSASKAALASVTRTLGVEWAKHGVSVLNFAPGYIETEINAEYLKDPENRARREKQIPVRRIGRADEVGRLVAAVLNSDCSFLTGETITIDGGEGIKL